MLAIERVLEALQREQIEFAIARLVNPIGKTEFDYGQLAGFTQGLQRAIEIIHNGIKEPSDDEPGDVSSFEKHLRGETANREG